jgi:hypothetical protein
MAKKRRNAPFTMAAQPAAAASGVLDAAGLAAAAPDLPPVAVRPARTSARRDHLARLLLAARQFQQR